MLKNFNNVKIKVWYYSFEDVSQDGRFLPKDFALANLSFTYKNNDVLITFYDYGELSGIYNIYEICFEDDNYKEQIINYIKKYNTIKNIIK
jgi:hypothetical protein